MISPCLAQPENKSALCQALHTPEPTQKVSIEKSKKLIKISILALLLTYAAFFCYGAVMAFDFCNGPMGPADPSEQSACFQLNHTAYQRLPLLIDHPAFGKYSFFTHEAWQLLDHSELLEGQPRERAVQANGRCRVRLHCL